MALKGAERLIMWHAVRGLGTAAVVSVSKTSNLIKKEAGSLTCIISACLFHTAWSICSVALLISPLAERISLFFFFSLSPLLFLLPAVALVFALFPSIKEQPFHLRLSHFPGLSMQFSSHPGAGGLGVDLGLPRPTPYFERTEHLPPLPRDRRALPPKTGGPSTPG